MIDEIRNEIKTVDEEILALIEKRCSLAREIGRLKLKNGLGIVDKSVEKAVMKRYVAYAEEHALDPDSVEDVCRLLIYMSVEEQKKLQKK